MRVPRIFHPEPLHPGATVSLFEGAVRHVRSVLRLLPGDEVELFDGDGGACRGRIEQAGARAVQVALLRRVEEDRESPLRVELALGISRGERMDFAIQKAVELGVAAIRPLQCERSVVRLDRDRSRKRVAHWEGVIRSACEQCGRNRLPGLAAPRGLDDWLGSLDGPRLALMPTPGAACGLRGLSAPAGAPVLLLIGPEGGLSPREREAATGAGFTPVRLGPRVLRTETAAVASITAILTLWGDLG